MSKKARELAARYRRKYWREVDFEQLRKYHFNAFAHPQCAVVTNDEHIQSYQWGLIPFWIKDIEQAKQIQNKTINARAETVFTLPSFRKPIRSHRCIIPSTGFFEWHHQDAKTKIPYFIFLRNEPIFSLAGIFDEWANPQTGEIVTTFSILTTQANTMMAQIHNVKKRMPVILSTQDEERWLDSDTSLLDLQNLLQPYPAKEMDAYQIAADFLSLNPYDEHIVDKI